jgi:hypothetical protein
MVDPWQKGVGRTVTPSVHCSVGREIVTTLGRGTADHRS